MRTTSSTARAAVLTAAAALALGVLPGAIASPASAADPVPPVVSYVDTLGASSAWLTSGALDGTGTPTRLTPSTLQTDTYDVSDDGDTLLVGGIGGAVGTDPSDVTYGLVLVTRTGATTTAQLLATDWYGNPVLSADGSKAYWLSHDRVYVFNGSATAPAATTAFAWTESTEHPTGLAISPDGTHAAVIYRGNTGSTGRIRAASLTTGTTTPYITRTYSAEPLPRPYTLAWADADTIVFSEVSNGTGTGTIVNRSATLVSGGAASLEGSLADFYDVTTYDGSWWMWKDSASTSDYGTSADPMTAPASTAPGLPRSSTYSYRLSAVTPPELSAAPAGRPAADPVFYLGVERTVYGRQVPYVSFNSYLKTVPGLASGPDTDYYTSRGMLQTSTNGSTWVNAGYTSGAVTFAAGGSPANFYNGYTKKLTRNTYFRWVYPGDLLTLGGTSARSLVTVSPIVSAKVTKKGSKRKVAGSVTRVGGTASLYRLVRGKYVRLVSKKITSAGAYSFGFRKLAKGTYRVYVSADSNWASAFRKVTI